MPRRGVMVDGRPSGGEPRYDVFLSYNSEDLATAWVIADQLEARGVRTFFDKRELVRGRLVQEELEKALASSASVAVLVSSAGLGRWHSEEMRVALDQAKRRRPDLRVIPVLINGGTVDALPPMLACRGAVDLRGHPDDPVTLGELVAAIQNEVPGRSRLVASGLSPQTPLGRPSPAGNRNSRQPDDDVESGEAIDMGTESGRDTAGGSEPGRVRATPRSPSRHGLALVIAAVIVAVGIVAAVLVAVARIGSPSAGPTASPAPSGSPSATPAQTGQPATAAPTRDQPDESTQPSILDPRDGQNIPLCQTISGVAPQA